MFLLVCTKMHLEVGGTIVTVFNCMICCNTRKDGCTGDKMSIGEGYKQVRNRKGLSMNVHVRDQK